MVRSVVFALVSVVGLGGCSDPLPSGRSSIGARGCALDRSVIDASHVVRISSSGVVESVVLERENDPRRVAIDAFPIEPGARPDLTRVDGARALPDVDGGAVALIGQSRTDLPAEWAVHALATRDGDAHLQFDGPCGVELDRQLGALRAVFGGDDDLALVARMLDEALLPGRAADLRNIVAASGPLAEVTDPLPPRWEGRVRVVHLTVTFTPQGRAGVAALQSEVGTYGIGVGDGLAVTTLDTLAVVPLEGGVQVAILDDTGGVLATPIDLPGTGCSNASGIVVSVDLDDLTASCRAGITPEQEERVDAATVALRIDDAVAVPAFSDGPPGTE